MQILFRKVLVVWA